MTAHAMSRQDIREAVDALSDAAIEKLAPYVDFLRHQDDPAEYGNPSAETLEAIKEVREGNGVRSETADELFEYLENQA